MTVSVPRTETGVKWVLRRTGEEVIWGTGTVHLSGSVLGEVSDHGSEYEFEIEERGVEPEETEFHAIVEEFGYPETYVGFCVGTVARKIQPHASPDVTSMLVTQERSLSSDDEEPEIDIDDISFCGLPAREIARIGGDLLKQIGTGPFEIETLSKGSEEVARLVAHESVVDDIELVEHGGASYTNKTVTRVVGEEVTEWIVATGIHGAASESRRFVFENPETVGTDGAPFEADDGPRIMRWHAANEWDSYGVDQIEARLRRGLSWYLDEDEPAACHPIECDCGFEGPARSVTNAEPRACPECGGGSHKFRILPEDEDGDAS